MGETERVLTEERQERGVKALEVGKNNLQVHGLNKKYRPHTSLPHFVCIS